MVVGGSDVQAEAEPPSPATLHLHAPSPATGHHHHLHRLHHLQAEAMFKRVAEAYDVLSDPTKRSWYALILTPT